MENYESLIMQELAGHTPKQKYEFLITNLNKLAEYNIKKEESKNNSSYSTLIKSKYTREPWEVRGNVIFIEGTYRSIATISVVKNWDQQSGKTIEDHEQIANTKLIAAAPDLLRELIIANNFVKSMANRLPEGEWKEIMGAGISMMESAIKKATE